MPARPTPRLAALLCLLAGAAAAQTAAPLYKIVEPDGRVTYTDRPVPHSTGRVTPVGVDPAAAAAADDSLAVLPTALRAVAARFPVTLFATTDCQPCDRGRELLRQRGIPFRERLASTDADREAWPRVVGSMESPALAVGAQMLRGFAPDDWSAYLDAAGYPRDGRLPPNYQAPPPGAIAETRAVTPPAAARVLREEPASPRLPLAPVAPPASGIRF